MKKLYIGLFGLAPAICSAIVPGIESQPGQWLGVGYLYTTIDTVVYPSGTAVAISDRFMLTAEHCIFPSSRIEPGTPASQLTVSFGGNEESGVTPIATYRINDYFWYGLNIQGDVALMEFAPGTFSHWYSPYTASDEIGKTVFIVGAGWRGIHLGGGIWISEFGTQGPVRWGKNVYTNYSAGVPNEVQFVYDGPETAIEHEARFGLYDSGGPSFVFENGVYRVIGIHSGGTGGFGSPYSDARVSRVVPWISYVTGIDY